VVANFAEAPAEGVSVAVAGGARGVKRLLGDADATIDEAGVLRLDALGAQQVAVYRLD